MRISNPSLFFLLSFLLLVAVGCGGNSGPAKATTGDELSQFLQENPEIANAEEEEEEEDAEFDDPDE